MAEKQNLTDIKNKILSFYQIIKDKYPIKKISELSIGFIPEIDAKSGQIARKPKLWGKEHHEEEYTLLVASKHEVPTEDAGAVPISLVQASVPVQYRIKLK